MADYGIYFLQTKMYGKRTRPGKVTVESGDTIQWKNALDEEVYLTIIHGDAIFIGFPGVTASMASTLPPYTVPIPSGGFVRFQVVPDPPQGDHPYKALCVKSNEYADGDSDPRIDVR